MNGRLRRHRPGSLRLVGLREIRLPRLRVQRIRNLRGIGSRVGSGFVGWPVKNIIQLVQLPGIDNGGRVSVHGRRR
jgi:hypothetical protein